jgi:hypothetical protein
MAEQWKQYNHIIGNITIQKINLLAQDYEKPQ